MKKHVDSNLKRCPLLKITRTENIYDDKGNLIKTEVIEDFNECLKTFCMAWDSQNKLCSYFTKVELKEEAEDEDEDDE